LADLAERRVPFFRLSGSLEERIFQVNVILQHCQKFGNVLDLKMQSLKAMSGDVYK